MSKPESVAAAPAPAPEPAPPVADAPDAADGSAVEAERAEGADGADGPAAPERVGLTKTAAAPVPDPRIALLAATPAGPRPLPEPASAPASEPAPAPVPASGPVPETPAAPGPVPVPVPEAEAAPEPAPPADPWAAPAAAPAPPAGFVADPWAAPAGGPPPGDPAAPRPTGWAAVAPASQSGFQPGFGYPPAPTGTNGFAIASLATALFCLWPLALVFAIVALVQIPRRNQKGRGLAVAGLVLGVLAVIVSLVAFIGLAALGFEEERYGDARRGPKGSVAVNDLRTGDCFNQPPVSPGRDSESAGIYWVRVVPCSAPHHAEVAGITVLAGQGADYPTRSEMSASAEKLCGPVRDEYALDSWIVPEGMDGYYYYPSVNGWATGDRRVICTFQDERKQHSGSVHTDRTKLTPAQRAYLDAVLSYNNALLAEPEKDVAEAPADYRAWAKTMAAACRKEVAELSANGVDWPEGARAKLIELGANKLDAANAWDTAAKTTAPEALEREVAKAQALSAKSGKLAVEIRGALGLSTGEQAADIRA